MTKKQRIETILKLIEENEISTQEELTYSLNSIGFNVSQATVSRDINELNLIKVEGLKKKYKYVSALKTYVEIPQNIKELFKHVVTSIVQANNLVLVKTLSGNANSAGMAVDQMHIKQILGTVAGDDTLLVVAKSESDAEIILKTLRMI